MALVDILPVPSNLKRGCFTHVRLDLKHLQAKQGGKAPTGWRSGLVSGSIENRGDVVDAENAGKAAADRGEGSGDENPIVVYGDKPKEWRVLLHVLYALYVFLPLSCF